jgi:hypothetical protein
MNLRRALLPYVAGAAVAVLFYAGGILAPARRVRELRTEFNSAMTRIRLATESIQQVRDLERECAGIRMQLAQREDPLSSALVWVPEEMNRHFGRFAFLNVTTRPNTTSPEPGLPGYQRTYWAVALPLGEDPADIDRALLAISELEAADPLLRVHNVSAFAEAGVNLLGGCSANLTVSLLTREF